LFFTPRTRARVEARRASRRRRCVWTMRRWSEDGRGVIASGEACGSCILSRWGFLEDGLVWPTWLVLRRCLPFLLSASFPLCSLCENIVSLLRFACRSHSDVAGGGSSPLHFVFCGDGSWLRPRRLGAPFSPGSFNFAGASGPPELYIAFFPDLVVGVFKCSNHALSRGFLPKLRPPAFSLDLRLFTISIFLAGLDPWIYLSARAGLAAAGEWGHVGET